MYPGPPPPPAPKPRPNRLAAGLCWLVAGAVAVVATFFDIYRSRNGSFEFTPGFWQQWATDGNRRTPAGEVPYGVSLLIGAVFVLAAALLLFVLRRRRVGMVVGMFGTGVLVAEGVDWLLIVTAAQPSTTVTPELGFWLLVAAAVVALVAAVLSVAERAARTVGYAPPQQPPPPRWEPPTPRYGLPVQQPPERTVSIDQPKPPVTGTPEPQ